MDVSFHAAKDRTNLAKHGVALADATATSRSSRSSLTIGLPGSSVIACTACFTAPYCLAAVLRDGVVRAISLRRAHLKEFRRHVR